MIDFDKITINQMVLSDLEEIKDILFSDFDNLWNYEIFKEELANNNSSYLVLRYDNKIVCYGGIKIVIDEADVMDIVTKKDMRGNGFARILLNDLINLARKKKCTKVNLEVNSNNTNALHLYETIRFKQVGLRKKYYNNTDDAILMTLEL